ncbi:MAG: histidinol-phosphate aminotransferase family protein [Deltaproteobacteria bacterium]|nr:histidinol-phosphate aminotransferase family protein [Deltaproteobacteria bacterium]
METTMLKPSPLLAGVTAYSPPTPPYPIDLKLDGNEGQAPPADLLEEVLEAGPEIVRSYPSTAPLESEIAGSIGIDPSRVIVTAGGDDAIERAVRAMLAPGREMILPVPTFEMFERYAALTGCRVKTVPWPEGAYPANAVLAAVTDATALVVAVTPNSPSGLTATRDELARISRGAPSSLLLVDLAYVEFADEDLTSFVLTLPNALVVRSLSKAWGLAGLRVGWAAGPAEVICWLRAAGHPYAVSGPSLRLASVRLRTGRDDVARFAGRIREERRMISERLAALGARVLPSQANFVLARFEDAEAVRTGLAKRGIAVRIFPGRPDLEGRLRITLPGDGESFERLVRALSEIIADREVTS